MWIIGGYQFWEGPNQGIYQIDLSTLDLEYIPVTGFPSNGEMWLSASSAVWVASGYKIFFFGGLMRNSSELTSVPGVPVNNIWEIDLTPQYCCGKSNGLFPHPDDCKRFIRCASQVTTIFSCPLFLMWNPIQGACDLLTNVICVVSGILP